MKARTSYLHTLKASDIIPRGVEKFAQPVATTARRTIRGRIMREARLKSIENDGRSCSIDRWKIGRFKSKIKMEGERYLTSRLSVEEKRTWFFSVDSSNTANFISHLGRVLFFLERYARALYFWNLIDYFRKRRPFRILDSEGGGGGERFEFMSRDRGNIRLSIGSNPSLLAGIGLVSTRESFLRYTREPWTKAIWNIGFVFREWKS